MDSTEQMPIVHEIHLVAAHQFLVAVAALRSSPFEVWVWKAGFWLPLTGMADFALMNPKWPVSDA